MRDLIIIGDGETAEMAFEYLNTSYNIIAFAVESKFLTINSKFELPIYKLEEISTHFNPKTHVCFVAVSFIQNNKLRERLYNYIKKEGFSCVSYVHPSCTISPHIKSIGENCLILEQCVLQRKVTIGDNVFIWSNSTIAHQSEIKPHAFLASNAIVSGFCSVGERSFIGAGVVLKDFITISNDCIIGAGAVVVKNTESNKCYIGSPAKELIK